MKLFGLLLVWFGAICSGSMAIGIFIGIFNFSVWTGSDIVFGAAAIAIGSKIISVSDHRYLMAPRCVCGKKMNHGGYCVSCSAVSEQDNSEPIGV